MTTYQPITLQTVIRIISNNHHK